MSTYVSEIVASWRRRESTDEYAKKAGLLKTVPVLFLDHLGTMGVEKTDGIQGALLLAGNDHRHHGGSIIVTSNLA